MIDALLALFVPLLVPLRALAFALAAAILAAHLLENQLVLIVIIVFVSVAVGAALFEAGRRLLPERPRVGLLLMEGWILAPLSLALLAAALAVLAGVALMLPGSASAETEVAQAAGTAIATFLASAVVAWSEDQNGSRSSSRIQAAFYEKYKGHFDAGSEPARWVYSNPIGSVYGWGLIERWARAKNIASHVRK